MRYGNEALLGYYRRIRAGLHLLHDIEHCLFYHGKSSYYFLLHAQER